MGAEEGDEVEAWPPGKDRGENDGKGGGDCEREARRVNADSQTKDTATAGGREEHGKRAKVKGTSGGFKFKATVSVCLLLVKPHLPSPYTSTYNNNYCTLP
ncbi:hypothetical protein GOODEAATRI_008263 [Goodea atripinnis]|uniref:Uncharacterized protein n=1 Tax=Goodea atripinnis TaxID=208336 RepID=A0ABV0N146_9TELE